jgi:cytochrome b
LSTDAQSLCFEKYWSLGVRLLHWTLALSMILSFITHEGGGKLHEIVGYVALISATFRVLLGLFGSRRWRFSSFMPSVATTLTYVKSVVRKTEPRYLGHNPLGAWMVLAMLFVAISSGLSGWLYTTDRFWGIAWVGDTHNLVGHALLPLLALHMAGAIFTSLRHKENLIAAMIHGKKRSAAESDIKK